MRTRFSIVLLLLFLVIPTQAQDTLPVFNEAECPMELPENLIEGEDLICGYITVMENRENPDSRTLDLAVAIIRASGENPQNDPIVFLTGGPGQGALGFEGYWSDYPTVRDRSFILIDPRGTGYSEPDMDCSSITYPAEDTAERPLTRAEIREADIAWAIECRDLLRSRDIDLTMYNTATWAADINDLRLALGLDVINLYGVSYGSYWALGTLRDFPEHIRTVTLDSVSPQPVDFFAEEAQRIDDAFQQTFDNCLNDVACAEHFPDIEINFENFLARLQSEPILLPSSEVNWTTEAGFVNSAYTALYDPTMIPILPLASEQIIVENNLEVAVQLGDDIGNFGITDAIYNSVICHDEVPFTDREAFADSIETYPLYAEFMDGIDIFLETCEIWGAGEADPIESEPVVSDVPVLILTGTLDPVNPPRYARIAAETLNNSYVFEFPTLSHAVTFFDDCPKNIMAQFVDAPDSEPDSSCIVEMAPITYLTDVATNPAVFQFAKNTFLEPDYLTIALLIIVETIFMITVFAYPTHWWRNRRQSQSGLTTIQRIVSWITAFVLLGFSISMLAIIISTSSTDEAIILFGLPGYASPMLALIWLALILMFFAIILTLWHWYVQKKVLLFQAIFIIAGLLFMVILWMWGFFT